MKIVVLGGGISTERHVSLVSATSVCKGLRSLGHKAIFVDMFLGLEDYSGRLEDAFDVEGGFCGNVSIEHNEPDLDAVRASRKLKGNSRLGSGVLEICSMADCVYLALHGEDGEDGKIQAALDLMGVPYTGSKVLPSALAMEKDYAKAVFRDAGILTPAYTDHAPCVLKTVNGGSSIGTYLCNTDEELEKALEDVRRYNARYIIEQRIFGREVTVPMLGGRALTPIEIVPPTEAGFDYIAKYQTGAEAAGEICPARLTEEEESMVRDACEKANLALGVSIVSRTDFIIDDESRAWCLEINTLPGMTPSSLIPKSARLEGLDYPHLCERIVELSINH